MTEAMGIGGLGEQSCRNARQPANKQERVLGGRFFLVFSFRFDFRFNRRFFSQAS
jgi:hypothetical protein